MKNPKILPFGQWFKVYESAGRNFEKSQRILESRMARGLQRVFEEALQVTQLPKLVPGDPAWEEGDGANALTLDSLEGAVRENYTTLGSEIAKLFLGSGIKLMDVYLRDSESAALLLDAAIIGSWRKTFSKNSPQNEDELYGWLNTPGNFEKFGFKISPATVVDLQGRTKMESWGEAFFPQARGRFQNSSGTSSYGETLKLNDDKRQNLFTLQYSNHTYSYINSYNCINVARGYDDQYKMADMLDDQQALVFTENVAYPKTLYFYSDMLVSEKGPSKNTEDKMIGGAESQKGAVEIAFMQGEDAKDAAGVAIDGNHPKVAEIGEKIKSYLGEKGVIDTMTLTSSASPEWTGPETMADYAGKTTSGTGVPAPGTDFAAKNADLAYRRGVAFQNALTAYLGGHVKANSITVAWKISTDEPGKGRHISYDIATKSESPQVIQVTKFAAGKTSSSRVLGKVNEYNLTWNIPTEWMSKDAQKGLAKDAENAAKSAEIAKQLAGTKIGYMVNIQHKSKPDELVEVKIEKIEGENYFTKDDKGQEIKIENFKDRFKGWTKEQVKNLEKEAKKSSGI